MRGPLNSDPEQLTIEQSPPDIFARLQKRGIEYTHVKRIVQFERPQDTLFFSQWFTGRTIRQVLRQLDDWKGLLKKDFILSLSKDLKSQVEQLVLRTELFVWRALIEANCRVGPWDLHIRFLPTGHENGHPVYIHPAREIIAVHRKTKKTRRAQIPGGASRDLAFEAEDLRRAFEELGLWNRLWKGNPTRRLISRRAPQGWPVYTRLIIPRLYGFMAPYYQSRGHYWARHGARSKRPAQFRRELLEDMLEILRLEHPQAFGQMTFPQLKAAIQRHLARKTVQKKPFRKAKELTRPQSPKTES